MIPVLMITYNRLDYTKQALAALVKCKDALPYVIDNGSTDGTQHYLIDQRQHDNYSLILNPVNIGIAGAMNQFLEKTRIHRVVGKVDNDTIAPGDWLQKMMPHMAHADIVQSRHHLIAASGVGTFDEWVSKMPAKGPLRFNHFVGGTAILFKRDLVRMIPDVKWKLGGWRQWQKENPEATKAFATDVTVELLDTNEQGADYSKYPEYYKETGRW